MRHIVPILSASILFVLAGCGAFVDSEAAFKEGECVDVTPPSNNTAQRDDSAGAAGGGS